MDIEGLGESVVGQLVSRGMVKDLADIYNLKREDLLKLELFKEKKSENLLAAIQRSKNQSLSRLVYGLGIRHVGEKAAYVLAMRFPSMDKLIQAKHQDFDQIYEVGEVMAKATGEFFKQESSRRLIERLKEAGVNLKQKSSGIKKSVFTGKAVVFTGELTGFGRLQAQDLVRQSGGNVSSSVSANTDLVVLGDNPGSKYDKAKKLGLRIITEEDFKEMIR
jgi:DNA ligase (NAD+)